MCVYLWLTVLHTVFHTIGVFCFFFVDVTDAIIRPSHFCGFAESMSPTKFNLASQTARADKTSPVPSRAGTFTPLVGARLLDHEGPRTRDERDGTTENSQRVVRVVPPPKTSNNMHALVRSLHGVRFECTHKPSTCSGSAQSPWDASHHSHHTFTRRWNALCMYMCMCVCFSLAASVTSNK